MSRRAGTVAVAGRPNAGKSTLVNALVGTKVAIVSDKPQTTRRRVLGMLNRPDGQIVFVDTPGLHRPLHRLNRGMLDEAMEAILDVDLVVLVIDAADREGAGDRHALELVGKASSPRICILNKVDLVAKPKLLPRMAALQATGLFQEIVPVSALSGDGLAGLPELILKYLPEQEDLYPADTVTMSDEKTRVAELIREKFLERTREEIPYGLGVVVEEWKVDEVKNLTLVTATLVVDKENHKRIVIGLGGQLIRDAGTAARIEIEKTFGKRFFLDLHVVARPGWREDPRFLGTLSS
ncbi:MAG: GTPase Era [Holophagales bacterium]|nr:GTPase Era [Holophagales bacterium]MBK9967281.1 GTPase Era [Holophagales bacterium]